MTAIFHYTDANGLKGILSSNTLFATHYKYLNDLTEAAAVRDLIIPVLEVEVARITPELVRNGWLQPMFYDVHGTSGHRTQAEKIYASFVKTIDNVSPFYVTSLCRHEKGGQAYKHGLLSQWRAYANTVGFAIEFNEQELDKMLRREKRTHAYAGFRSADVHYDNHNEHIDPTIYRGLAGEVIREQFNHENIDVSSVTGHADIDAMVIEFAKAAPFIKHPSFIEEKVSIESWQCVLGKEKFVRGQNIAPKN
jgi:Protein of unknown function (DUF2971)